MKRLSISVEELEQLFLLELVKAGVGFPQAAKAAKFLANRLPEEQLTSEDNQLIQDACALWLAQRKRLTLIEQVLNQSSTRMRHRSSSSSERQG